MSAGEPQDVHVDRRSFVARMAVLSAGAAVAGTVGLPRVAFGSPVATRTRPGPHPDAYTPPRPEALADPTELTVAEAAYLLRAGSLRPETLLEAYLDRIAAHDGTYQAFNLVLGEQAAAAVRALRRGHYHGPLHGIPLAIKDNYYTEGVPTTANSFVFAGFVPPFDATAVARLRSAGGIVLGKTQMGPLATTRATTPDGVVTTVNAWTPENPSTNPGGSSTGTGTAVAGRLATSGIGTQTGGSITAPSNAQNLTGLKPTMGRASLYGIVPLTYSRDHPGPLARDAKDAAIMLSAMAGEDADDPRTQGLPPVPDLVAAATPVHRGSRLKVRWPTRIGVIPGFVSGTGPAAAARRAFLDTLAGVEGVSVVDVTLPDEWDLLTGRFNDVRPPERAEPFVPYLRQDLRLFGVSLTSWLQGALMGADEYVTGQRAKLVLLERVLGDLFAQCDVVVQTSPVPFDIIGLPELALPIGFSGGLPVGTILGGRPYAEDRLLAVAAAYQALTDWHWRRPPDPAAASSAAARGGALAGARPRLTAAEAAEQSQ